MNINLKPLQNLVKFVVDNKTTIMTILGLGGMAVSTYNLVKKAPEVKEDLEEAKVEKGEDLTFVEKTEVVVKDCWPEIITWVTCSGSIIGAHVIDKKVQMSLAGTAALMEHKYHEYRQANISENGIEADRKVRKKIADDSYRRSYNMAADMRADEQLFYEPMTDTWFVSTMEDVKEAHFKTNRNFILKGMEEFIFFLDSLGILNNKLEREYANWVWDQYTMEALDGYLTIDMDIIEEDDAEHGKYYIIEFPVEPCSEEAMALRLADCGVYDYTSYQEAIELDNARDERLGIVA